MSASEEEKPSRIEEATHAFLNQRVETLFSEALLEADPNLNLSGVSIVSDLQNTGQLTVLGVDSETLQRAVSIFQRKQP